MSGLKDFNALKLLSGLGAVALVAACSSGDEDSATSQTDIAAASQSPDYGYETYSEDNLADTMASNDGSGSNDARQIEGSGDSGTSGPSASPTPVGSSSPPIADTRSAGATDNAIPDPEDRPMMQLQVVLDRIGFGPGVIDGLMGMSTENALMGYQEANGLEVTGEYDAATKDALSRWDHIPATRVVTIPESWGSIDFTDIPESNAAKARLERMGYTSLDEKVAERFHTTIDVLKKLNPNGRPAGSDSANGGAGASADPSASGSGSFFRAGQQIRVPNIGADRIAPGAVEDRDWQYTLASLGVGTEQPQVDRIVVSKSEDTLKAYRGGELVAKFTVTSGSSAFPLPLGEWDILGEAYRPTYQYDPEVLGEGSGETYTFPPGPNSPVGVVWIDLSKEHYGIHGTAEPETIGRAVSHGCVRLTNWDAARLTQMVSQSTEVIFEA